MKMQISAISFVKESLKTNIVKTKNCKDKNRCHDTVIKRGAAHSICNSK